MDDARLAQLITSSPFLAGLADRSINLGFDAGVIFETMRFFLDPFAMKPSELMRSHGLIDEGRFVEKLLEDVASANSECLR